MLSAAKKSDEALMQEVRAADSEEPSVEGVSESSFLALMHRLGVTDDATLQHLFHEWDLDGSHRVSVAALTTSSIAPPHGCLLNRVLTSAIPLSNDHRTPQGGTLGQ